MTTTLSPEKAPESSLAASRPRLADRSFRVLTLGCGLLVLAILGLIAVFTTNKAWPAFSYAHLGFITHKTWSPADTHPKFGALAFIYGTTVVSLIALVIAVPVSLGIALFLTELAPRRLRTPVVYLIDVLATIPSVVYGLWGILVLAAPLGRFYGHVANFFGGVPVFDSLFSGNNGRSIFTAGLIVAMMILPIITSLTREVFATVPRAQKEAALALGATRWEMMRTSILGYGRTGVVGAVMLGLGRAMGETIAVALVIGAFPQVTAHLFASGDTMASRIVNEFSEATGTWQAALIAMGVTLFAMTIVINMAARAILSRSEAARP